jgi:hypothetical protein
MTTAKTSFVNQISPSAPMVEKPREMFSALELIRDSMNQLESIIPSLYFRLGPVMICGSSIPDNLEFCGPTYETIYSNELSAVNSRIHNVIEQLKAIEQRVQL